MNISTLSGPLMGTLGDCGTCGAAVQCPIVLGGRGGATRGPGWSAIFDSTRDWHGLIEKMQTGGANTKEYGGRIIGWPGLMGFCYDCCLNPVRQTCPSRTLNHDDHETCQSAFSAPPWLVSLFRLRPMLHPSAIANWQAHHSMVLCLNFCSPRHSRRISVPMRFI